MSKATRSSTQRDFLGEIPADVLMGIGKLPCPAPRSDRKIRMGIVGGGFGTSFQWHLDPNCIVEAVSDPLPEARERLKKNYRCDKTYDTLEELVRDPKIEAVGVFTAAPDHARHVMEVMKHGKHCVSAVPACLTLEDAAALKEAKERTGLRYMMAETSYYRWPTILARGLWREGRFGEFLYSEVEYYHPGIGAANDGLSMRNGRPTWRYGYPPMLYPTHATAFHVGVTGERLADVSCLGWGNDEKALRKNAYDNPFCNQVALFRSSAGNLCRCNVFWHVHADGERAQWLGSRAALYMDNVSGQPLRVREEGREDIGALPNYLEMLPEPLRVDAGHGNSHTFLTHEFLSALVEDREPAVDVYEALAMTVPGIVAMESSRRGGERLKVPRFERP